MVIFNIDRYFSRYSDLIVWSLKLYNTVRHDSPVFPTDQVAICAAPLNRVSWQSVESVIGVCVGDVETHTF